MLYIGLDVGTSSLKTTVMDEMKQIQFEASYGYRVEEREEGMREIDPELWFQAVMQGLKDIFLRFDKRSEVIIGVSGQMHTTVFLDEDGNCVRKAIMWNDLRSAPMVPKLKKQLATMEETKYIARILSSGSPAMNALWVKEQEPFLYERIRHIMSAYDYIVYRLTGTYCVDYCDASTSALFDIATKTWSTYMLQTLAIPESYVGELHASCDIAGTLLPSLADSLQVTGTVQVIVGTGDNPASAVAMGILHQKKPVISLGTSGVVILPKQDHEFAGIGKNVLFKAQDEIVNIVQGSVRSAGGTHKWWVENIVETTDMRVDQEQIETDMLGKNKVLFFPHITGDKLLYQDMDIRGAFVNLSLHTKRVHMTQAVFEGVSFALKEVLDSMDLTHDHQSIQINGGGSKSEVWMHILANVLNREIEVVARKATPGYGVCLMAYMAIHGSIEQQEMVQGVRYQPCVELVDAYAQSYETYKRMYAALREITR